VPQPRTDTLLCRYAAGLSSDGLEGLTIPMGEGVTGWAARHLTGTINARAAGDFKAAGAPTVGSLFHSALTFPLIDGDQMIAVLTAYHVDEEPYTDAHLRLLERLGGQVASVLATSIQFEGLRAASLTDSLTELPNSRALIGHVDQRLAASVASAVPSAIIMIDLDEFKTINDVHGHQMGDIALQTLATTLRRQVRASDFCARYGGDEFVVALACQDRSEAERRARDLQRAVARQVLTAPNGAQLAMSISVGVAMSEEDGATFEALLEAADRRMYADKHSRKAPPRRSGKSGTNIRLARAR
jgi:diguanylate cyclase (GGDEF)-like protein